MARIRSINSSMFTEKGLLKVSALARLLYFGLLCEADDAGAFEWEPPTLKARILPVDNCDIDELLGELVQAGVALRYKANGGTYGLLRGFRDFQRPRRPRYLYPVPASVEHFTGGRTTAEEHDNAPADLFEDETSGPEEEVVASPVEPNQAVVAPVKEERWQPSDEFNGAPVPQLSEQPPPEQPVVPLLSGQALAQGPPLATIVGNLSAQERRGIGGEGKGEEKERKLCASHTSRARARARARVGNPLSDLVFLKFWDVYPGHERLGEAYDAWTDALEAGALAEDITAGVARYPFRDEVRFIPAADRWLRRRDWLCQPNANHDPAMRAAGLYADGTPLVAA